MAVMFTRTVKTYKATAFELEIKDGEPVANIIGSAVYSASSDSEGTARKALKNNGTYVPRGAKINVECIGEKKYGMTVDEFMQYAHEVD